jgi:hypothetical protein
MHTEQCSLKFKTRNLLRITWFLDFVHRPVFIMSALELKRKWEDLHIGNKMFEAESNFKYLGNVVFEEISSF